MKKLIMVFSILLSVGMAFYSCGGSSINCGNACNKLKECNSTTDLTTCESNCGKMNDALNGDVLSKLNNCTNQSCNDIFSCEAAAFQNCTTDLSGLFNKICEQIHGCGGIIAVSDCVNSMSALESSGAFNTLKCLDGGFLNSLASCASNGNCDIPAVTNCIKDKTSFLSTSSS